MNLLTVTTCVEYSDFLSICIPKNISSLKNWHIITTNEDIYTQNLCNQYNLECFITNSFYKNGSLFNKGAALNDFFLYMMNTNKIDDFDWILLLDSDIIVNDSIESFNKGLMLSENIYSCRRIIFENQQNFIDNKGILEQAMNFIGYFQLFNKDIIIKDLVEKKEIFQESADASTYDENFRDKYWNYGFRNIIDGVVYHLGPTKRNWKGRKTQKWE